MRFCSAIFYLHFIIFSKVCKYELIYSFQNSTAVFTSGTSVSYCAHAEFPLFPFHPSFSATTLVTLLRARARLRMNKVQYGRWRCALSCFANRLHVHKKCKPRDVSLHRCRTLTWTTGSNLLLCLFVVWSHSGMFVFTLIVRSGLWGQV